MGHNGGVTILTGILYHISIPFVIQMQFQCYVSGAYCYIIPVASWSKLALNEVCISKQTNKARKKVRQY